MHGRPGHPLVYRVVITMYTHSQNSLQASGTPAGVQGSRLYMYTLTALGGRPGRPLVYRVVISMCIHSQSSSQASRTPTDSGGASVIRISIILEVIWWLGRLPLEDC